MTPFALCPLQSYDCSVSDSALPLSIARQWIVSPQVAPCPIKTIDLAYFRQQVLNHLSWFRRLRLNPPVLLGFLNWVRLNTSPIVLDILTFVVLEECPTDLSFMPREDIIFFILVLGVRIVWCAYLYGDCASSLLNFLKFRKVVLPHFLHCVGVAARKSMCFLKVTVLPPKIIPA